MAKYTQLETSVLHPIIARNIDDFDKTTFQNHMLMNIMWVTST